MKKQPSKTPIVFIIITLCLFLISQTGEAKEFADGKIELFFGPPEYGADEKIVVLGSLNLTKPANKENDENVLIIKSPDIAVYVTQEFERIWQQSATSE